MDPFFHESRYRQPELMEKLKTAAITICGAGALGANILESLARAGAANLRVIDRDRVEEHNLSTQPYFRTDVGSYKAKLMANTLYRALGVAVDAKAVELTADNVHKLLRDSELVIDTFDNSTSRGVVTAHCADSAIPCLHAGMAPEYSEVIWNDQYIVPSDANDDICDYPLARNLVMLTTAVTCEVFMRYLADSSQENYTVTFGDLKVSSYVQ